MTAFDLTPPTEAQRGEITAGLSGAERRVLLEHGTEAAFCVRRIGRCRPTVHDVIEARKISAISALSPDCRAHRNGEQLFSPEDHQ